MSEGTPLKVTPFLGSFILETLTVGMYGESRNAIREYIQNAFDSVQSAVNLRLLEKHEGLIEIELSGDRTSLVIRDNGAGIPVGVAVDTLTSIGSSGKDYRKSAGFRGIGRLAGIVFSTTVTFRTKAEGDSSEAVVVFDASKMRKAMSPGKGSRISAEQLLTESVTASLVPHPSVEDHFFEVTLADLSDPPEECVSFRTLYDFVSQVAPVPYSESFKYRSQLEAAAKRVGIPIDEVRITIKDGSADPTPVLKRYSDKHCIDGSEVVLNDCEILESPAKKWWGWVGTKSESAAYDDSRVSGLRVRVKNIQIDGTDIIREVFRQHAKSYVRFTEYFIGEVFVDPAWLVPNARRDGFEENANWRATRKELTQLIKTLGQRAYDLSTEAQQKVTALAGRLEEARQELLVIRKEGFENVDRALTLSHNISKWTALVNKASVGADRSTAAALNQIGSELSDIKSECIRKLNVEPKVDIEKLHEDVREQIVLELMTVFEAKLSPRCMSEVRLILKDYLGS